MKLIIKEGAKFNQILRIKDSAIENLVNVLDLPLEVPLENGQPQGGGLDEKSVSSS